MREEDILDALNNLEFDFNENYYKMPEDLKNALMDYFGRDMDIKHQRESQRG